jgi:hypothetical protein
MMLFGCSGQHDWLPRECDRVRKTLELFLYTGRCQGEHKDWNKCVFCLAPSMYEGPLALVTFVYIKGEMGLQY